jgi:hypothetical protein
MTSTIEAVGAIHSLKIFTILLLRKSMVPAEYAKQVQSRLNLLYAAEMYSFVKTAEIDSLLKMYFVIKSFLT